MKIIENNDLARIQQNNKIIGKGKNGVVYLYNENALKIFSNFSFRAYEYFNQKQKKSEELQKLNLSYYTKIIELYGCTYFNKDIFCTYEMQYLDNNLLKEFNRNSCTLEDINYLLHKILQIIACSNKEGIYNLDLKLQNFCMLPSKNLIGLDIDDLKIKGYDNKLEYFSTFVSNYIDEYDCLNDYDRLQRYAFLGLCLELWITPEVKAMNPIQLIDIINKLNIDESFKNIMLQIIYGENIELEELLYSSINSEIKMVRK